MNKEAIVVTVIMIMTIVSIMFVVFPRERTQVNLQLSPVETQLNAKQQVYVNALRKENYYLRMLNKAIEQNNIDSMFAYCDSAQAARQESHRIFKELYQQKYD